MPDDGSAFCAGRRRFLHLGSGAMALAAAACQPAGRPGGPFVAPTPAVVAQLYADTTAGVWRDGRLIAYSHGMEIRTRDEIETDGANFALIEFLSGDGVYMKPATRVRVGSIFVFFGEIFNRVVSGRGFRADSEALEAGVEETEFMMRVDRGSQEATVTVRRGIVRCTPRRASWVILLRSNERLSAQRIASRQPRPTQVDAAQLIEATQWADAAARRLKQSRPVPEPQRPYPPATYPQPPTIPQRTPPVTR